MFKYSLNFVNTTQSILLVHAKMSINFKLLTFSNRHFLDFSITCNYFRI